MCKTIKNSFDEKLTFINLLEAHKRAKKGKGLKKEVILFEMDLETNITNILNELKNEKYKFGSYREFIIYEPKERIIKSLPYRDRVVHQWFVEEFIKPFYMKRFINNTYACIDTRGNHKAVLDIQKAMKKMFRKEKDYYVLKCDIKKYFYSIDKQLLFNIIKRKIKDKKILSLTSVILNDGLAIGIPIGNYTSQFFANIYLNELDYYVKHNLKVKYYFRYMDDFILLVESKRKAKIYMQVIKEYLNKYLDLELNSKSRYYHNKFGINFCGYIIFNDFILLRKRFKNKIKKNIKLWKKLERNNKLDRKRMGVSYNSFKAHASHADSYRFMEKINCKVQNI